MKRNVPNEVSLLPSNYSLYDRVHLLSFFIVHLFGDYFSSMRFIMFMSRSTGGFQLLLSEVDASLFV
jgi:hypothetical protein